MKTASAPSRVTRVSVIDSHTGGEPTRVVLAGGPDLGGGPLVEQRQRFASQYDHFRSAVVNEPRGSDVMVGALLCEPSDSACVAGVIFFNNVGMLGMCGHGTIGVAVTLAHLNRIEPGWHKLQTPVGQVGFLLHEDRHRVTLENVPSYRHAKDITVDVPGYGTAMGDIAWGGNWFFLIGQHSHEISLLRVAGLMRFTTAVRDALQRQGVTGKDGAVIDHIELLAPCSSADSRSFVLCPGGAWDRSPCGTGTSAKVACLAADGRLKPGETWRQESIIGTQFEATYRCDQDANVVPSITGSAWITAEVTLLIDDSDPFAMGIRG